MVPELMYTSRYSYMKQYLYVDKRGEEVEYQDRNCRMLISTDIGNILISRNEISMRSY